MSTAEIAPTPEPLPIDAPPPVSSVLGIARELKYFTDISIDVTIEIGRLQVGLGDLVGLEQGKVLRIRKAAGEPFDICANGQPVARGEVIVVENSSGVRLTEILKL